MKKTWVHMPVFRAFQTSLCLAFLPLSLSAFAAGGKVTGGDVRAADAAVNEAQAEAERARAAAKAAQEKQKAAQDKVEAASTEYQNTINDADADLPKPDETPDPGRAERNTAAIQEAEQRAAKARAQAEWQANVSKGEDAKQQAAEAEQKRAQQLQGVVATQKNAQEAAKNQREAVRKAQESAKARSAADEAYSKAGKARAAAEEERNQTKREAEAAQVEAEKDPSDYEAEAKRLNSGQAASDAAARAEKANAAHDASFDARMDASRDDFAARRDLGDATLANDAARKAAKAAKADAQASGALQKGEGARAAADRIQSDAQAKKAAAAQAEARSFIDNYTDSPGETGVNPDFKKLSPAAQAAVAEQLKSDPDRYYQVTGQQHPSPEKSSAPAASTAGTTPAATGAVAQDQDSGTSDEPSSKKRLPHIGRNGKNKAAASEAKEFLDTHQNATTPEDATNDFNSRSEKVQQQILKQAKGTPTEQFLPKQTTAQEARQFVDRYQNATNDADVGGDFKSQPKAVQDEIRRQAQGQNIAQFLPKEEPKPKTPAEEAKDFLEFHQNATTSDDVTNDFNSKPEKVQQEILKQSKGQGVAQFLPKQTTADEARSFIDLHQNATDGNDLSDDFKSKSKEVQAEIRRQAKGQNVAQFIPQEQSQQPQAKQQDSRKLSAEARQKRDQAASSGQQEFDQKLQEYKESLRANDLVDTASMSPTEKAAYERAQLELRVEKQNDDRKARNAQAAADKRTPAQKEADKFVAEHQGDETGHIQNDFNSLSKDAQAAVREKLKQNPADAQAVHASEWMQDESETASASSSLKPALTDAQKAEDFVKRYKKRELESPAAAYKDLDPKVKAEVGKQLANDSAALQELTGKEPAKVASTSSSVTSTQAPKKLAHGAGAPDGTVDIGQDMHYNPKTDQYYKRVGNDFIRQDEADLPDGMRESGAFFNPAAEQAKKEFDAQQKPGAVAAAAPGSAGAVAAPAAVPPTPVDPRKARIAELEKSADGVAGADRKDDGKNHFQNAKGEQCSPLYINGRPDDLTPANQNQAVVAKLTVCIPNDRAGCGKRIRDDLAKYLAKGIAESNGCVKDGKSVKKLGGNGRDVFNDNSENVSLGQANSQAAIYEKHFRVVRIVTEDRSKADPKKKNDAVVALSKEGVLTITISNDQEAACPASKGVTASLDQTIKPLVVADKKGTSAPDGKPAQPKDATKQAVDCVQAGTDVASNTGPVNPAGQGPTAPTDGKSQGTGTTGTAGTTGATGQAGTVTK